MPANVVIELESSGDEKFEIYAHVATVQGAVGVADRNIKHYDIYRSYDPYVQGKKVTDFRQRLEDGDRVVFLPKGPKEPRRNRGWYGRSGS